MILKKNSKIAIIDFYMGNLLSLKRAFDKFNTKTIITNKEEEIIDADIVVLPGVGAFKQAMENIIKLKLDRLIYKLVEMNIPILAICLGAQLLMDESEEHGKTQGLGLIKGKVVKIKTEFKLPRVEWDNINSTKFGNKKFFFSNIKNKDRYYFIHSYKIICENEKNLDFYSHYNNELISSIISKKNIIGTQFHPEKSSISGLNFIKNYLEFFLFNEKS